MNNLHQINQAKLELNFDSIAIAEQFDQKAHHWVLQELLPHIEQLFDKLCPSDQVISINQLELDLGDIPADNLFTNLLNAIEQQLIKKIAQFKPIKRNTNLTTQEKNKEQNAIYVEQLPANESRWHKAWQFFQTGRLHWSMNVEQSMDQIGLADALLSEPERFIKALEQVQNPDVVITRLINQLSPNQIVKLLKIEAPPRRDIILVKLLGTAKSKDPELFNALNNYWRARFAEALTSNQFKQLAIHWNSLVRDFSHPLLEALYSRSHDAQIPFTLLHSLNEAQRLDLLKCLEPIEYPFLYSLLSTPHLWRMSGSRKTQVSDLKKQPASLTGNLTPTNTEQQLWLFTLHFLLVEKGSQFNKQQYMLALLIQMAASGNQSAAQLFLALEQSLAVVHIDSRFKQQMQQLLSSIKPKLFKTKKALEASHWQQHINHIIAKLGHKHDTEHKAFITALMQGNETELKQALRQLESKQPSVLKPVFYWAGQSEVTRQYWAENFSDTTLLGFVRIIEPLAVEDIRTTFSNPSLFTATLKAQQSQVSTNNKELKVTLWQFTFSFLLVERGSEFNRQSYLQSLTHQMAARRNIHQSELITAMIQALNDHSDHSWLSSLYALLQQWQLQTGNSSNTSLTQQHHNNQQNEASINHAALSSLIQVAPNIPTGLILALQRGMAKQWEVGSPEWLQSHPSQIKALLNAIGKTEEQRRLWAEKFSDVTLLTFIQLINAKAAPAINIIISENAYILSVLNHPVMVLQSTTLQKNSTTERKNTNKTANQPIQQSQLKKSLWELTLTYLLAERGSEFNQRSYLASLTLKLAARYNQNHQTFLQALLASGNDQLSWYQDIQTIFNQQYPNAKPPVLSDTASINTERLQADWKARSRKIQTPKALSQWIDTHSNEEHYHLLTEQYSHLSNELKQIQQKLSIWLNNTPGAYSLFWHTIYQALLIPKTKGTTEYLLNQVFQALAKASVVKTKLQQEFNTSSGQQLEQILKTEWINNNAPQTEKIPFPEKQSTTQIDDHLVDAHSMREIVEQRTPPEQIKENVPIIWQDPNAPEPEMSDPITVHNSGVVLAASYIPMLMQKLNLTDGKTFLNQQTLHQGIFCLEWLANGRSKAPEYQLTLNKILCGLQLNEPIPDSVELPETAVTLMEGLLTALIGHWKALGSTSIDGLRSTFFQREGELTEQEKQWQLSIAPGPFDMLLDQLPWSFQTIKYPWMDKPLFVSWR